MKSIVSTKMSILLAVIALVLAGCFLLHFAQVLSSKHHCKVSCDSGGLFTDELGLSGGQSLLYLVNCLISLLKHAGGGSLEVVV